MKQKTITTLLAVFLVLAVGYILLNMSGIQLFQAQQTGQPSAPRQSVGYQPYPMGTLTVYLKDKANPTNPVLTSTVKAKVFSLETQRSAVASPITPYLDSDDIDTSTGAVEFTAKKVYTGNSYWVKVWDSASTPTWYAELVRVDIPAYTDANVNSFTAPDVMLSRIGAFADPMQEDATGSGGGSLQTGVSSDHTNNKVTIDLSDATDPTITVRFKLTFANSVVNSRIKNVVLRPVQDTTSPMPTTAFTSATVSQVEGVNFGIAGDILPYVSAQTPINLGDWTDSTSAKYYLQVSIDKASLSAGQKFYFRLDDLGNWLAVDDIAGQSGASPVYIMIEAVA